MTPRTTNRQASEFLSLGGRVVAELVAGRILDRRRWCVLRSPEPSIGYDVALLEEAKRRGATIARNRDEAAGFAYVAPIERLEEHGFVKDFGWGRQVFLPVRLWDKLDADGKVIPATAQPASMPDKAPVQPQLSLFGEVSRS